MAAYKLLVLDADGTLVDRRGQISETDKLALSAVRANGIQVALSTGRAVKACTRIFNQITLPGPHIFFDGALVFNPDNGVEIYADPIDADLVRQMAEYLHRIEINMDFYSAARYFIEKETWATEIRRTFFGLEPTVTDFARLWQTERIIKGTLIVRSAEDKAKAQAFYEHFKGGLKLSWTKTPAYPDVDFINVLAPDVSKGVALEALSRFLKIPIAEVMAIGDGSNDIPLLKTAGLSIAMAGASAEVKAAAKDSTADVDHNGVAEAIRKYLGQPLF